MSHIGLDWVASHFIHRAPPGKSPEAIADVKRGSKAGETVTVVALEQESH